jgi:hypothetical protein
MLKRLLMLAVLVLALTTFVLWVLRFVFYWLVDVNVTWKMAVSMDRMANTVFNGDSTETISSRAGRHCFGRDEDKEWWACILCNKLLDKIEPGHCKNNIGV